MKSRAAKPRETAIPSIEAFNAEKAVERASANDRWIEPVETFLERHGTTIKARRRQRISSSAGQEDYAYFIKSGVIALAANSDGEQRHILTILYPGDVLTMGLAPPLEGVAFVAMTDCVLVRLARSALDGQPDQVCMLDAIIADRTSQLHARASLHIARLANLPSEERVAAFLLELGLRTGRVANDSVTCDLPLSRCEIADYLSLNADTLSRIMTRLKARDVLATVGRSRAIVKSVKRLCKEVPMCRSIVALHSNAAASTT